MTDEADIEAVVRAVEDRLRRAYVVRADARQISMGLSYVEAETRDLARVTTAAAIAALRACGWRAVPKGWKLVPVEDTEEMRDAFFTARDETFPSLRQKALANGTGCLMLPSVVWEALLSAAPEPPA